MGEAVEVGGFVEVYGALNPAGAGVVPLRGFDAHAGTFALSLAALEVGLVDGPVRGRAGLQAGPTALAVTSAEPALRSVREAWVGVGAPGGTSVDGGLFLSPVGYDAIAAKDNRCWSLSNLGVGLPFTFTGARVQQALGDTTATLLVVNGWNRIVDAAGGPSVFVGLGFAAHGVKGQVAWMGGDEGTGAFRQLLDAWGEATAGAVVVFAGADVGLEARPADTHAWAAAQAGAEWTVAPAWTLTARGDVFHERGDVAANVFWPTPWLGEGTLSLGVRPAPGLLARLEARHDRAADPVFRGVRHQSTVTLGLTGGLSARVSR